MCEHYYICVTGWKTNAGTFNTLSGCGSKRPPAPPGLHLISIQGGGVGRSSQKHSESTLLKYIPPLSEDINLSHQKVCVCHLCVKHLTQIKLSPCAHIQRGNKSSLPGGTKQLLISLWEADGVLINTNSSMITAIQNKRPRLQPDGTNSPRSPQFTCRTLHRCVTSAGPTNTLAPYAQIYSGDSPVFYNQSINHQSISCLGPQMWSNGEKCRSVFRPQRQSVYCLRGKKAADIHIQQTDIKAIDRLSQ